MMNNTQCTSPNAFHRELSFGSWTVVLDRSPKRICGQAVDFTVGLRWAALGVAFAAAALLFIAL